MVDCYRSGGNFEDALLLVNMAQATAKKQNDTTSNIYAGILHKKALVLTDQRDYSSSNKLLEHSIAIRSAQTVKWDTAVGGHISPGESPEEALKRETEEELGIKKIFFTFNGKYIWESSRERELVYSYRGSSDEKPHINPDEIDDGGFWPLEKIRENLGRGVFTPNFEREFKELIRDLTK